MTDHIRVRPDVAAALAEGRPVVALESTIISHGLPRPDNLRVAHAAEAAVRRHGAVPATVAILGGQPVIGLTEDEMEHVATAEEIVKVAVRDIPTAVGLGRDGATTVSATAALSARAGIRVFATGGLGGVHREARDSWDESADLVALSREPVTVVCAGVKSILDVGATLERLETLGVPVVGYRTDRFPAFYLTDSGYSLDWRVDSPAQVAAVMRARREMGLDQAALVVANPLPAAEAMHPALHDRVLAEAMAGLDREGVTGKDVTPYLLAQMHERTGGASLAANERILVLNAALAAEIATADLAGAAPA